MYTKRCRKVPKKSDGRKDLGIKVSETKFQEYGMCLRQGEGCINKSRNSGKKVLKSAKIG